MSVLSFFVVFALDYLVCFIFGRLQLLVVQCTVVIAVDRALADPRGVALHIGAGQVVRTRRWFPPPYLEMLCRSRNCLVSPVDRF